MRNVSCLGSISSCTSVTAPIRCRGTRPARRRSGRAPTVEVDQVGDLLGVARFGRPRAALEEREHGVRPRRARPAGRWPACRTRCRRSGAHCTDSISTRDAVGADRDVDAAGVPEAAVVADELVVAARATKTSTTRLVVVVVELVASTWPTSMLAEEDRRADARPSRALSAWSTKRRARRRPWRSAAAPRARGTSCVGSPVAPGSTPI